MPVAALRKLKPRQAAFVKAYTTPGTPAFGIGKRAALVVNPELKDMAALKTANRMVNNPNVRDAIEAAVEALGTDETWSLANLRAVANGEYQTVETTERPDADGIVQTTKTVRSPKASDVVKAIDIVNKMRGLYERRRVEADVSKRLSYLASKIFEKQISSERDVPVTETAVTVIDSETSPHRRPMRGRPVHYLGLMPCTARRGARRGSGGKSANVSNIPPNASHSLTTASTDAVSA